MALNNVSSAVNNSNAAATNVNNATTNNDALNSSAIGTGSVNSATSPVQQQANQPNENLVRIEENSPGFDALFDILHKNERPLQIPLRMRNLPNSFFNPPSTGSKSPSVSHTRENSVDSAFGSGTTTICSPNANNASSKNAIAAATKLNGNAQTSNTAIINPLTSRLQISHSRAHSSPASLQQTYAGLNASTNANPIAVGQQVTNNWKFKNRIFVHINAQ